MTTSARELAHIRGVCIQYVNDEATGVPEEQRRHWPDCDAQTKAIESALRQARNDALEEAAKIAEDFRVSNSRAPHKNIRDGIAKATRALKQEG